MTERVLSQEALQAMLAENTGDVVLPTLKIIHDDLEQDLRLVSNTENITFNGEEYQGLIFSVSLPKDTEEEVPAVRVSIDNVDPFIVETIRSISSPPLMELGVLLIKTSGAITMEYGPASFRLNQAEWDSLICEGALGYEADYLNEPAQADHYDPTTHPGLFV